MKIGIGAMKTGLAGRDAHMTQRVKDKASSKEAFEPKRKTMTSPKSKKHKKKCDGTLDHRGSVQMGKPCTLQAGHKGPHAHPKSTGEVREKSKERRFLGLMADLQPASFAVPARGRVYGLFERIECVKAADGKKHIIAALERGRSVEITSISSAALLRCYIETSNTLVALFSKELDAE